MSTTIMSNRAFFKFSKGYPNENIFDSNVKFHCCVLPDCGSSARLRNNLESSSSLDPLAISSSSSSERFSFGTLVDERDGQVYKTIVIADSTRSQTWMAENLNFEYPTDPSSSEPNNYCQSDSA